MIFEIVMAYLFFGLLLVEVTRSVDRPPTPAGVVGIVLLWPIIVPLAVRAVLRRRV